MSFQANAAAAGLVLLVITLPMNAGAIYLRYRLRKHHLVRAPMDQRLAWPPRAAAPPSRQRPGARESRGQELQLLLRRQASL